MLIKDEVCRLSWSLDIVSLAFLVSLLFPIHRLSVVPEVVMVTPQWDDYDSFQECPGLR